MEGAGGEKLGAARPRSSDRAAAVGGPSTALMRFSASTEPSDGHCESQSSRSASHALDDSVSWVSLEEGCGGKTKTLSPPSAAFH